MFPASQFWPLGCKRACWVLLRVTLFHNKKRQRVPSFPSGLDEYLMFGEAGAILCSRSRGQEKPERQKPRSLSLNLVISRWFCKFPPSLWDFSPVREGGSGLHVSPVRLRLHRKGLPCAEPKASSADIRRSLSGCFLEHFLLRAS